MHQDSFCRRTSITEKRHGGRRLSDDRPRPPPSRPGTFIKPMYSIRPIAATVRRFHGSLRVSSPPPSPRIPPPRHPDRNRESAGIPHGARVARAQYISLARSITDRAAVTGASVPPAGVIRRGSPSAHLHLFFAEPPRAETPRSRPF